MTLHFVQLKMPFTGTAEETIDEHVKKHFLQLPLHERAYCMLALTPFLSAVPAFDPFCNAVQNWDVPRIHKRWPSGRPACPVDHSAGCDIVCRAA